MIHVTGRRLIGVCVLLCAMALYVLCPRSVPLSHPLARFSAGQIVERTAALCQTVIPRVRAWQFSPVMYTMKGRGIQDPRYWMVEARGEDERVSSQFVWNADTGALWDFSWSEGLEDDVKTARMSRQQAIIAAWDGLCALRLVGPSSSWRLASVHLSEGPVATICWQSGTQTAVVRVTTPSGNLVACDVFASDGDKVRVETQKR